MKFYKMFASLIILVGMVVSWGCPGKNSKKPTEVAKETLDVAFIYPGPISDAGWTYSHDQARRQMEKNLPYVRTSFVESVKSATMADKILEKLAKEGKDVIIATSAGFWENVERIAPKYPKTIFLCCAGEKTYPNVGTYFGRIYQVRFLSGIVAGKMTKTNKIGFVGAFRIPEVISGINAFTLGVRKVNPKAKVLVVWTNTWFNPAVERQKTVQLINKGCDIIAQHTDTPSPQQTAQEYGKYSIGYNCDMSSFAPKSHLVAPVWNWNAYYDGTIEQIHSGVWKPIKYFGGLKDGIVDLSPMGPAVPEDVKHLVDRVKAAMIDGKFDVFDGPIRDNKGKLRIKLGEKMSDENLAKMDFFVEGVEVEGKK